MIGDAAPSTEAVKTASDRAFFGHPIALPYLLGTEVGWAFGFFGLQVMLTLYMTQSLLKPGHVEHVIGFPAYRAFLQHLYGPLTNVEIASQTFGLVTGLIYALPILGGFLADRWLGQRRAMVIGMATLVVAHLLLVSEPMFLVSIALMVVGTGLVKTNMLGQIGRLYAPGDDRRGRAFGLWLIALNTGSMITPLISGTLGERLGWGYGFAALAVGMALGAISYIAGYRKMPPDLMQGRRAKNEKAAGLTPAQFRIIAALVVLLAVEALWTGIYNQAFNVFTVWAEDHVERHVLGFLVPVTWCNTLDGLMTILGTAAAVRVWAWRARTASNRGDVRRVTVGFVLAVAGFLILTLGAMVGGAGKAPLIFEVLFFVCVDFAIPWIDTVILTMVSRDSPAALTSTMLGLYYVSAAAGNFFTGWLGGFSDRMHISSFWLMHAAIAGGCLVFLALARGWLGRLLHRPESATDGAVQAASAAA